MKNGFKRTLSMLLCLTMVLGLFCYAPEASAAADSGIVSVTTSSSRAEFMMRSTAAPESTGCVM